ncbi:hypothetical protein JOC78_000305 [Bacillus ectoiniformans]|uniref:membrane lipoprotein lipid attachment site-containing protein n=1 Tax=Bacillus ectoiniformans TaxID=1494429 RepID=UPI00195B8EDC|nr:membrane lipoprotein lipid attachment site-containing protein [Bacillus ectoiniformans]MBM7647384.1 hypothetical protein [Bacillus ectoiniformans]
MKKIILTLVAVAIGFLLSACSSEEPKSQKGYLTIEPSQLFVGDTKKLEPHMGLIGGAVHLKYDGDYKILQTKYEIWEKGKLTKSSNAFGTSFEEGLDDELTFSLKTNENMFDAVLAVSSNKKGYSSSHFSVPKFNEEYAYGPVPIEESIKVKEGKDEAMWGLIANKDGRISSEGDINKAAKVADWAFVVKVSIEEEMK